MMQAQDSALAKRPLEIDDYKLWAKITDVKLSPDGHWMLYKYDRNEGEDTLFVQRIGADTPTYVFPGGYGALFSDDSRWMVALQKPEDAEKSSMQLADLNENTLRSWDHMASYYLGDNSRYLIMQFQENELSILDLHTDKVRYIGKVKAYAPNKRGSHLAYLIDAPERQGNGLYVLEMATEKLLAIDTDTLNYHKLAWDDQHARRDEWAGKGRSLACLKGLREDTVNYKDNQLVIVRNLGEGYEKHVYKPAEDPAFPEGMVIFSKSSLSWHHNGGMLFFGIKEQAEKIKLNKDSTANVDVWHWQDPYVQWKQMRMKDQLANKSYSAVLHLDGMEFVQLGDSAMPNVGTSRNPRYGYGVSGDHYISDLNWAVGYNDFYRVDLQTGQKELFADSIGRGFGLSPEGEHFLYMKHKKVFAYHLNTGETYEISAKADDPFYKTEDDHPYEKPPYGLAGWDEDVEHVFIYSRFDIWKLALDGTTAECITMHKGREQQVRYRLVDIYPDDHYLDIGKRQLVHSYGLWTKNEGFAWLRAGKSIETIMAGDKKFGNVRVARDGDRLLFTRQDWQEFPDYWATDREFNEPFKLTRANPQQARFLWGEKPILVDFTNSRGDKLQGVLYLPAGYEQGKRYPMLTYYYEIMTDHMNEYDRPRYNNIAHSSFYTSHGYMFFVPDIVYETGKPGNSAVDCITSGVQKVIDLGYADPGHIGIEGHSWGGYQTLYTITQTDMFACAAAGAGPVNLISFYNTHYRRFGHNQQGITEHGQVRMGVSPFEDMELYRSQSPLHHAQNITTPLLMLHGMEDDAVEWMQALEMYNTCRRLGKECVLLAYPGEPHNLKNKTNVIDFQRRLKAFMDHHLKEMPAPGWYKSGVPYIYKPFNKAE